MCMASWICVCMFHYSQTFTYQYENYYGGNNTRDVQSKVTSCCDINIYCNRQSNSETYTWRAQSIYQMISP